MEFINPNVEESEIYSGYHDYHDHHGECLNMPIGNDKPWMIGVELETYFPDEDDRDRWCDDCESNWFFMESDCSLPDGGCEFITTPLAPDDAKNPDTWYPLIKALREAGVRSYNSSSTGLHVHISKTIFGDNPQEQSDCIGRLLYLYYYVLTDATRARVFGRRGSSSYAKDLDKGSARKTTAASDVLKVALKYKEVRDEVSKELVSATRMDRYYTINLQNSETVEFRQGKGSVNNRRVAAICEFVEACCLYVRDNTDISRYTEAGFLCSLDDAGPVMQFYMSDEQ